MASLPVAIPPPERPAMPAFHSRLRRVSTVRPRTLRVDHLESRDLPTAFATLLGGGNSDFGVRAAVDATGNTYVLGGTFSTDLPVTFGTHHGDQDIYLAKLGPTGELLWATWYGGSDHDGACDLALDGAGNVYVSAQTESNDFPTTPGAYQATYSGTADVTLVLKVNGATGALTHATYLRGLSGSAYATAFGIAVDAAGSVYLTGGTQATDFPTTPGAVQTVYGGSLDVFVTKMTPDLSALVYSTYLGGAGLDQGWEIAVDAAGNAYVAGNTGLTNDFPTTAGALRTTNVTGHRQAFAAKLDPAGALAYSTYLGGTLDTEGYGLAVDAAGSAYVTGYTKATDFPVTAGAAQGIYGGGTTDGYVAKLSPSGGSLVYATYLGAAGADRGWAVAVDAAGNAYVTGETASTAFPVTPGASQGTYGGGTSDAYLARLNPSGGSLTYSTYLCGSGQDTGRGVTTDAAGNAYLAGATSSTNFPTTPGAVQSTYGGGPFDMFVTGQSIAATGGPAVTIDQAAGQADPASGSSISFDVVFAAPVTGFTGSDIDFTGSTVGGTLSASVNGSGSTYTVTVTGMTGQGTVIASVPAGAATDAFGNPSLVSTSTDNQVTYDGIAPTVIINQAAGQEDPTNAGPITFDVSFSEPVTGFDPSDIDFTGSTVAGGLSAAIAPTGLSTYTVTVTGMVGSGAVVAPIPAGVVTDSAGNPNSASTGTDNVVTFDGVPPTVTINQAAGQDDPTSGTTITFDVTFSEPVTGLDASDIDLSASTAGGALTPTISQTGPTAYAVSVTGMTTQGSVIASIPAAAAADGAGNPSEASTSTDNSVEFMRAGVLSIDSPAGTRFAEGAEFDLVVSRAGGSEGAVSVNVVAVAGTAHAVDFTVAGDGLLTWGDGDATDRTIHIKIEDDAANEGREVFLVKLEVPPGGT